MDDGSIQLYISCTDEQVEHNIGDLVPVTLSISREPIEGGYKRTNVYLKRGNIIYMVVGSVEKIIEEAVGQI